MVKENLKEGQKAPIIHALTTIFLASLKAIVGKLSGSVALLADALHDFSDISIDLAAFAGLKIAERKPTEKFPYGYYKAENLATFFISLLFLYTGFEILKESYTKLFITPEISYIGIALLIPLISAILALLMSNYLIKVGKKINSQSLEAIGRENKIHAIIAVSVFISLISSYYKIPTVEALVGIGISILVFKIAIETARDSIYALLDVSPGKEIEEKIEKLIKGTKGVESLEGLRLRKSGPFVFGEAKIRTKKINLREAHKIADKIEEKVKSFLPNLEAFIVHVEPEEKSVEKIAIPVENKKAEAIAEIAARAPYFLIAKVDKKKKQIVWKKIVTNPVRKNIRVGLNVAKFLIKKGIDSFIVRNIGDITFHTLRDKYVKIFFAEKTLIKDLLDLYFSNKLKELSKPTKNIE